MKFVGYFEDAIARIRAMGLTTEQIDALRPYGLLARDNVTGFYEGRTGEGRMNTLARVIEHVKDTDTEAYYVEMDLQNLSGLNAALGHTKANVYFSEIATAIFLAFTKIADRAVFFRHGGDEMSVFLVNTTEKSVLAAMSTVQEYVADVAACDHLDDIPHSKNGRQKGIGIHFGMCRILAGHESNPTKVFSEADVRLELTKGQP